MPNSYHLYLGDGNEGTFYDETVRNCPPELIDAYILDRYVKEKFHDEIVSDGDDLQGSSYLPDEGAFGASSLVIDYYKADEDDDCPRMLPSNLCEVELSEEDLERLRSIATN